MPAILVNPVYERRPSSGKQAPRLESLAGKTIALLDISKPGGNFFLDRLESLLINRHHIRQTIRVVKPTFTRPAPEEIIDRILSGGCDAVIEALAD
jgi:hypothetical protein